ncbi:MAG TPA: rhodanese-like domain-containing protein [Phycisphaerae bacterium]|nr:rhodanese-like domain-containing protein [Phycisphaerae bacterium]
MKQTLGMALLIVVAGIGAGVVANATWYDQRWIRQRRPITNTAVNPVTKASDSSTDGDSAEKDRTTSQPVAGEKASAVADPCAPQAGDKPGTVRMECVLHLLESGGAVFIDAREEKDYAESHLRGSLFLPSSAIYANYQNIEAAGVQPEDLVVIYCGGGDCEASHNVADELRDNFQFQRVFIYEKGWQEIESSGKFVAYIERGGSNG